MAARARRRRPGYVERRIRWELAEVAVKLILSPILIPLWVLRRIF